MKFCKLLKDDIRKGCEVNCRYLIGIIIIVFISCFDLKSKVGSMYYMSDIIPEITFADQILYLFCGIPEYVPSKLVSFIIPVRWFLINIFLIYTGLYFPYRDLHTVGVNVLIRNGSRRRWFASKCVWLLVNQLAAYICIYLCIFVFHWILGGNLSLQLTPEYINAVMNARTGFTEFPNTIIWMTVLLTFLVTMAFSIWQLVLTLFMKPIFAYIVVISFLLASAYFMTPVMIGNFAMPIRSEYFIGNGYDPVRGEIILCVVILAGIAVGLIKFRKYDIMHMEH